MNVRSLALALAAGALGLSASHADAVTINASVDGGVRYLNNSTTGPIGYDTATTGSTSALVGYGTTSSQGATHYAANTVMFFQLPDRPSGQFVSSASLSVFLASISGNIATLYNADVWGLGFKDTATIDASDFMTVPGQAFPGTLFSDDTDTGAGYGVAGRTKVIDNLFTTTSTQAAATSASGSLAAYLDSLYDAGMTSAHYLVLRVNPDGNLDPVAARRYNLGSLETAGQEPKLTIEFADVPEPASLALVGLGGLALLSRRRDA